MYRYIYLFIVLMILIISCGRKSGRIKNNPSFSNHQNKTTPRSGTKDKVNRFSNGTLTGPEIFDTYKSAVFLIETTDGFTAGSGTGFFISPKGVAITCYHVLEGAKYVNIKLENGLSYEVNEIYCKNKDYDYVVFKVDPGRGSFNYFPLASSPSKIGDLVYTISNPLGMNHTFASGEVSQYRTNNIIQFNAPVDHGSSGGALLNASGEVIGIIAAKFESSANLNYAINFKIIPEDCY